MNTKLIFAAAVAASLVTLSTVANAKPFHPPALPGFNCVQMHTCLPVKPALNPSVNFDPGVVHPSLIPIVKPVAPQPNGPGFHVNLNLGGGGYNGVSYDGGDGISCGQGRSIVRHHGFKHVHTMDCSGDTYAYSAFKHGQSVEVDVDSGGSIVDVSSN